DGAKSPEPLAILDKAQKKLGDRIELRLARARYWAKRGDPEARKALKELAANTFKPEDQQRLLAGLADAYVQMGERDTALKLYDEVSKQQPKNSALKLRLFDLALRDGNKDSSYVEGLLDDIEKSEGRDSVVWKFGRAAYLIWRAEKKQGTKDGLDE